MSLGKNLQYLRRLSKDMTQEALAEKLNVSRQTISKWEMDTAQPEIENAIELCKIFNCSLDNLFREEMDKRSDNYSHLRVEEVEGFRYIAHTVVSSDPEGDALDRVFKFAAEHGGDGAPPFALPFHLSVGSVHPAHSRNERCRRTWANL